MGTGRQAQISPITNSTGPVSAPISRSTISPSTTATIAANTARIILKAL